MTEMSDALRFMGLFRGYSQAYGTYNPSGLGGEENKNLNIQPKNHLRLCRTLMST